MGRPRLYNTPEEKKVAKATRNKRSYSKFSIYFSYSSNSENTPRHRDDINEQRRKKYSHQTQKK
jgi:hypothetical protein